MDETSAIPFEMLTDADRQALEALFAAPAAGAPAGYERVADVLLAVRLAPSGRELVGEAAARQAFVDATRLAKARARRRRAGISLATVAVTLGLGSGLAAAGSLPGPVQDLAARALDAVGVDVPDSHDVDPASTGNVDPPATAPGHSTEGHDPQGQGTPPLFAPGNPDQPTGNNPDFTGGQPADPGANGNHSGQSEDHTSSGGAASTSANSTAGGPKTDAGPGATTAPGGAGDVTSTRSK